MEQMVSIFWAEPEWIIPPTDDTATALEAHDFSISKFTERQIIFYLWLGNRNEWFSTEQRGGEKKWGKKTLSRAVNFPAVAEMICGLPL